jgi:hypothetical protein
MKTLRKAFNKFDKDGSGTIEANELAQVAEELGEGLTEEEVAEGMAAMDKSGAGVVKFEDFVQWIADERDKESSKGLKMRMLKLKMRANQLKGRVSDQLTKTASFSKDYVEVPDNQVRLKAEVQQGEVPAGLTQLDLLWKAVPEADGRAAMGAVGAGGDVAACVAVNIELLPGVGEAALGELEALYDQVFDMVNGEEMMAEMGSQVMLQGKPTIKITDVEGSKCLQVLACFSFDPFAQFGIDSRLLKTVHARLQWAHKADEVIKASGEQIDLLALEGLKVNAETLVDRKIVEWLAQNEEIKGLVEETTEVEIAPVLAAALTFGSADLIVKTRSVNEIFNKTVSEGFTCYKEWLEEYEDRRLMDADATTGMLTTKIVEMYCNMGGPIQTIYKDLKEKIAGPHSVKVMIPTAEISLTTEGLNVLHKFFPTPEEIEAHEAFSTGGGDDDDDDW